MTFRRLVIPALAAASVLALAGCAGSARDDDGRIAVVASTDVYGQIVEEVGGDLVDVTSIVSSASQDPHSFEPSARDQLAVSRADLIVENGGGYDAFIDTLLDATGTEAPILTAVEFSPEWTAGAATDSDGDHDHGDHSHVEGFNEHVWYDVETMGALAQGIRSQLEVLSPGDADVLRANLDAFLDGIAERRAELAAIDATHAGTAIFVTEPVPLYLTEAAGLLNVAPAAFTEAVEEGQDVPPATLLEALKLLRSGDADVVVANLQTGGAETGAVVDEAETAGIPVVEFTETLPDGQTYLSWMKANIESLAGALPE
ncbi:MAG: zinc ABC transporter substrate-binding protein [Microbacterium sp.]